MDESRSYKGKKVLVMGLGVFGGGSGSAQWFARRGAEVTVTDLRDAPTLAPSLATLSPTLRKRLRFVLGRHDERDFRHTDIVMVNPAVPRESPYLAAARESGAALENDTSIFFRHIQNPVIAVTGTRGKTTTTHYIAQLLSGAYGPLAPVGNTPKRSLLGMLDTLAKTPETPVVAELSSWQLEYLPRSGRAPHIAIITNIYPDHLNRYRGIADYASAKSNIFAEQREHDALILSADDAWTPFFLRKKPRSRVYFTSSRTLSKKRSGMYLRGSNAILRIDGTETRYANIGDFEKRHGEHNVRNLLAALLAVALFDPSFRLSVRSISALTGAPMRQEVIHRDKKRIIINDSTATSPDALIASIRRFASIRTIFIAGGTDKDLEMRDVARVIRDTLPPDTIVLLAGSATTKLMRSLRAAGYVRTYGALPAIYDTLEACVADADARLAHKSGTIVFSPGAASFEKFKNEFDRGERFAAIVSTLS